MIYSQEDIEDFKIQINELIQMNLIREVKAHIVALPLG